MIRIFLAEYVLYELRDADFKYQQLDENELGSTDLAIVPDDAIVVTGFAVEFPPSCVLLVTFAFGSSFLAAESPPADDRFSA